MPRVLLVEDNDVNRKLFRDILEIRFDVVEATSAEEALELLEVERPNLVLLDIELPGMDGLELVRRLRDRSETNRFPVVAISAHAMKDDIERAIACGCACYVTKPLTEDPFDFVDRMASLAAAD